MWGRASSRRWETLVFIHSSLFLNLARTTFTKKTVHEPSGRLSKMNQTSQLNTGFLTESWLISEYSVVVCWLTAGLFVKVSHESVQCLSSTRKSVFVSSDPAETDLSGNARDVKPALETAAERKHLSAVIISELLILCEHCNKDWKQSRIYSWEREIPLCASNWISTLIFLFYQYSDLGVSGLFFNM